MNLLFTSSGRRNYLIDYFAEALGGGGTIHVANSDPVCSAFARRGPRVVTPLIYDPSYIPFLLSYCREHQVSALISLFDIDLPLLAGARAEFAAAGVDVVVASEEAVAICNDKWRSTLFLQGMGLGVPKTYLDLPAARSALDRGEVSFPLIVKPRWGMGSIAVLEADSREQLECLYEIARARVFSSYLQFENSQDAERCILIQEKLAGQEYGLDVLNDLRGNHAFTSVKRKLAMRSGETDAAVTVDSPALRELGRQIAAALRHRANLDVDLFVDGGRVSVLELNCRFGGGYPFTHLAGADFPAAILSWLEGEEPNPEWLRVQYGVVGVKGVLPLALERGDTAHG